LERVQKGGREWGRYGKNFFKKHPRAKAQRREYVFERGLLKRLF
jgi:hypothetical protein